MRKLVKFSISSVGYLSSETWLVAISCPYCALKVKLNLDCVHTMPAHFENGENVTAAKLELVFTRYRNNLKTVGT